MPLTEVGNDDLRTRLVVVPQEPFLFDGTIADNLGFARPGSSLAELQAAVEALDLGEWLETLPEGLATMVGPRGAQLSAGERQLVALIRASLVDPAILVLDEATSSVDALTEVRLAHALERLAEGRTTIAIAHRLSTAAPRRPRARARSRPPRRGRPPRRPGRCRWHLHPHVRGLDPLDQHLTRRALHRSNCALR